MGKTPRTAPETHSPLSGVVLAGTAFLIWGMSPLYWKTLQHVPALQILSIRIIWSSLFLIPVLLLQKRGKELKHTLLQWKKLRLVLSTAILLALNWLIYVWAVTHDHVLQASLGYYISPLVNVILGMIFLRERLRAAQKFAVSIAAAAVLCMTVQCGAIPFISLGLACSFGLYGLIRKSVDITPSTGLAAETLLLSTPAVIFLVHADHSGSGMIFRSGIHTDLLLAASALVTALPLMLFNTSVKRLFLSTVGIMQYIAPSCMFLLAVLIFHEPITTAQILTFTGIWTALLIYSADGLREMKRNSGLAVS